MTENNGPAIGFIGAGRVGTAFGAYLKEKGFKLRGYCSRTADSARRAAAFSGSRFFDSGRDLAAQCDILFITTADAHIQAVCDFFAGQGWLRRGQLLVHMSGALSSEILHSAREKGCFTYSLHPILSFADAEQALAALPKTVFSLEGDEKRLPVLENILHQAGNPFFTIKAESKALYHAAACIFSNYLTALVDQGLQFFAAAGIDRDEGLQAVLPLIRGTIDNIALLGTERALTGPIARGDGETVRRHLDAIGRDLPEKLLFYKLMGEYTSELAQRYALRDPEKISALNVLLKV